MEPDFFNRTAVTVDIVPTPVVISGLGSIGFVTDVDFTSVTGVVDNLYKEYNSYADLAEDLNNLLPPVPDYRPEVLGGAQAFFGNNQYGTLYLIYADPTTATAENPYVGAATINSKRLIFLNGGDYIGWTIANADRMLADQAEGAGLGLLENFSFINAGLTGLTGINPSIQFTDTTKYTEFTNGTSNNYSDLKESNYLNQVKIITYMRPDDVEDTINRYDCCWLGKATALTLQLVGSFSADGVTFVGVTGQHANNTSGDNLYYNTINDVMNENANMYITYSNITQTGLGRLFVVDDVAASDPWIDSLLIQQLKENLYQNFDPSTLPSNEFGATVVEGQISSVLKDFSEAGAIEGNYTITNVTTQNGYIEGVLAFSIQVTIANKVHTIVISGIQTTTG